MRRRSVFALLMSSLMLLSLRGMKASPFSYEDIPTTTTTTDTTITTDTTASSISSIFLHGRRKRRKTAEEETHKHGKKPKGQLESDVLCGPNSQFEYGTICPTSCDNLYYISNTLCIEIAVLGCFCYQGYVLESDLSTNCVSAGTCAISCADNMHYQTGASYCQASCMSQVMKENCTGSYDGCVCDEGYVFSFQYPYNPSNVCILPSQCS